MKKSILLTLAYAAVASLAIAQNTFSLQDTLRGTITPERSWWNVLRYDLTVKPDYESKSIEGTQQLAFQVLKPGSLMQIDLQKPMKITAASYNNVYLEVSNQENVWYLKFPEEFNTGDTATVELKYSGKPRVARMPPWDGGWIWSTDVNGSPWMSVACQGLGASVWYPCKDHQSDEPDLGASMGINAPDGLSAVANGKLKSKVSTGAGNTTWTWEVVNPINSYNLVPYIGKYANWTETYKGLNGDLDLDFWVLDFNLEKAKEHFQEVHDMLGCFEHWFGPFPFYADGYKLVQSPHLGMEHQSAIAYGNAFQKGYQGNDLSGSGWGMKWDFIIIHESGHEWFGNNITTKDIADMWVHEGFTAYSETIYTTCQYGVEAGNDYVIGTRSSIRNDRPMVGPYGVNHEGSGDMYYKGANMLHTIRQLFPEGESFREMLVALNRKFYHTTVTSADVEEFMSTAAGRDLSKIFDQYLHTVNIPVLECNNSGSSLAYRWTNVVQGFDMPVKTTDGLWLFPTTEWQFTESEFKQIPKIDRNFYIEVKQVQG